MNPKVSVFWTSPRDACPLGERNPHAVFSFGCFLGLIDFEVLSWLRIPPRNVNILNFEKHELISVEAGLIPAGECARQAIRATFNGGGVVVDRRIAGCAIDEICSTTSPTLDSG
jgi:hypothetical protein